MLGFVRLWAGVLALVGLLAAPAAGFTGLNLNGLPDQLQPWMLPATGATWVRAFVDVVGARADVAAGTRSTGLVPAKWDSFRAVAAAGKAKIILSLKWDFETPGLHPPLPGSAEEHDLFTFLDRQILDPLAASTAIIVSGNEPFVNTNEADWVQNKAYGGIPVVVFYERVTAHVNDYLVQKGLRGQTKLFIGAFTRLYSDGMQKRPAVRQLLDFAEGTPFVDGVDLHAHVSTVDEIAATVDFAQSRTTKPLIVTEYTYIHAMKTGLAAAQPLGAGFARRWNVESGITELDYLRCEVFHRGPGCKRQPTVSKAEWDDFIQSRPWFIDHFLLQADKIFTSRGVMGATFGVLQGKPSPTNLQADAFPWYLGFLYSPAALGNDAQGLPLPNYQYLDDFRRVNGLSN